MCRDTEGKILRRVMEQEGSLNLTTSFIICTVTMYNLGTEMREKDVGGICGTHERNEKGLQNFGQT
jgi:hypothetical protein